MIVVKCALPFFVHYLKHFFAKNKQRSKKVVQNKYECYVRENRRCSSKTQSEGLFPISFINH